MRILEEQRFELQQRLQKKQLKIDDKMKLMEESKEVTFAQIDAFFEEIIKIAEKRRDELKRKYIEIEKKER